LDSNSPNIEQQLVTNINSVSSHEEVIKLFKTEFYKIDVRSCIRLAKLLLSRKINIEVQDFKKVANTFIRKNSGKLDTVTENGNTRHYIKTTVIEDITKKLYNTLKKIGTSLRDIDEDEEKWRLSNVSGVEAFEVTGPTTFQDIREKADKEGKHVQFRYDFSNTPKESEFYTNKLTTQIIDVHINTTGEVFDYPLQYFYKCSECGELSKRYEFEVSSVSQKNRCPNNIPGDKKPKKCNTLLAPDTARTQTKTCYVYNISFFDKDGNNCKSTAISFISLPRGYLQVAVQKIPNSYGQIFLHIIDYRPIEKDLMKLPKKEKGKHYIFSMVEAVQKHIYEKTGYVHYGYLPMKMSILLEMAARYNIGILNNFSMMLTGAKSSGKSQFAKYWGITLYSERCLSTMATSISIPKLRGTMESFQLFGKEERFQYRGLFAEKDLIVIDELKEAPDVKNNLKQYLLEPNYNYAKAGGTTQTHKRNCHVIATQNVDTKHLDKYIKDIKTLYQSDKIQLVNNNEPKPAWNSSIDLTLPLHFYNDNIYLKYAISKTRSEYTRNQVNWIDGSELALKQRFFFNYFLGADKTSKKLTKVIRMNAVRDIMADTTEIAKVMDPKEYREYFKSLYKYNKGKNDLEYFEKVDKMLDTYEKRQDARTKSMMYTLLKLIRIVDKRDYCTPKDLEIFQYILESLDNKVEVVDTNDFKIEGHFRDDSEELITEKDDAENFGYTKDLDVFEQ